MALTSKAGKSENKETKIVSVVGIDKEGKGFYKAPVTKKEAEKVVSKKE